MAILAKLRGVISGFGEVAMRAHIPAWLARPEVSIVAVEDPIPERRELALRTISGVRTYDRLEAMLEREAPDFVDITSPSAFHAASVRAALSAGAHALCEKPLCLTLEEFDELAALAAARARVLMCVHNWKYSPAFIAARTALDAGRLGAVGFITMDRLRSEPAGGGGKWRSQSASGGGILFDHGWHAFYLMHWLMDAETPLSISAYLDTPEGSDVEDLADLRVVFLRRRLVRAHFSWRSPLRRTFTALHGDRAVLEIEGNRAILTGRSGVVEQIPISDTEEDSYHPSWFSRFAEDFEKAVKDGPNAPAPRRNLDEARIALILTLAARRSAKGGGLPIELEPYLKP